MYPKQFIESYFNASEDELEERLTYLAANTRIVPMLEEMLQAYAKKMCNQQIEICKERAEYADISGTAAKYVSEARYPAFLTRANK